MVHLMKIELQNGYQAFPFKQEKKDGMIPGFWKD
jgi:hypothetical protein